MNDLIPLAIALLFVIVTFVSAMNNGVVKLLSSGLAAAASLVVFFAAIHLLPGLAEQFMDVQIAWKPVIGIASLAAIVIYTIARLILGAVLKKLLNEDSWFGGFADGIPGGVLSLIPSMVVVFFLFCCVRIAGTVQELNYTASLSQPGIVQIGGRIPGYPFSAGWRNGVESVPLVAPILDLVDPFSNRSNRNAAAIVIAKDSRDLRFFADSHRESAELIGNPEIDGLTELADVSKALAKQDRVELVLDSDLRKVASRQELNDELADMNLRLLLEDFVKSLEPETIKMLEIE